MAKKGGLEHKSYKDTKGLKVASGQEVKVGIILTRQGAKWKPGVNVGGRGTLYAKVNGTIYFTRRRGTYRTKTTTTLINIKKQVSNS